MLLPTNLSLITVRFVYNLIYLFIDYNIQNLNTNKSIVISSSSSLGNTPFLAYVFICSAIYSFIVCLCLTVILITKYKKFNTKYLEWYIKKNN